MTKRLSAEFKICWRTLKDLNHLPGLPGSFGGLTIAQAYSRPAAILIEKFNAGIFKRLPDHSESTEPSCRLWRFQRANGTAESCSQPK